VFHYEAGAEKTLSRRRPIAFNAPADDARPLARKALSNSDHARPEDDGDSRLNVRLCANSLEPAASEGVVSTF
jgi:hypothetical protein